MSESFPWEPQARVRVCTTSAKKPSDRVQATRGSGPEMPPCIATLNTIEYLYSESVKLDRSGSNSIEKRKLQRFIV